MSRQQKIIPPVKGTFQQIINNVTEGRGVKVIRNQPRPKNEEKPSTPPPKKP